MVSLNLTRVDIWKKVIAPFGDSLLMNFVLMTSIKLYSLAKMAEDILDLQFWMVELLR
jgi:hypothetical protein